MWLLPVYSALVAFVLVLAAGPVVIRFLVRLGTGQNVRDDESDPSGKGRHPFHGRDHDPYTLALAAIIRQPTKRNSSLYAVCNFRLWPGGPCVTIFSKCSGRPRGLRARDNAP